MFKCWLIYFSLVPLLSSTSLEEDACYSKHKASSYLVSGDWKPMSSPKTTYGNLKCPLELAGQTPTEEFKCLLDHQWEATTCKSVPFDAITFLSKLKSKLILLSGDSVTKQTYIALICHLYEHAEPDLSSQNIPWTMPVKLVDNEWYYTHRPHGTFLDDICFHFKYNVTICCCMDPTDYKKDADIVIWNGRGLHYHRINESNTTAYGFVMKGDPLQQTPEAYRNSLNNIAAYVKDHPSKLVVYRETSGQSFPGSYNGDYDNRDPTWIVRSTQRCLPRFEPINVTIKGNTSVTRSWSHMDTWRQRMEKEIILHEYKIPFLSIYETQFNLPCNGTGHFPSECTHFYLPGVPDAWVAMLYNFVLHSPLVEAWRESWAD